jgi:nicotinamidase-related amidase
MLPAALILIDLQFAIDDERWRQHGPSNNPDAEQNIQALLREWRERAWPVIHIRHDSMEPDSSYRPGQRGNQFKPDTGPADGEVIIPKRTNSAFIGTTLQATLDELGMKRLVVAGVITNNSVEATVRMAGNLNFQTILVSDGCYTFARPDFDGRMRTAEEVHAMSLANLDAEYCRIMTTRQILESLGYAVA